MSYFNYGQSQLRKYDRAQSINPFNVIEYLNLFKEHVTVLPNTNSILPYLDRISDEVLHFMFLSSEFVPHAGCDQDCYIEEDV